jgi:LCP family protein required for cell wall assembly
MDVDRNKQPKQRQRYGGIDGFIAHHPQKQRPIIYGRPGHPNPRPLTRASLTEHAPKQVPRVAQPSPQPPQPPEPVASSTITHTAPPPFKLDLPEDSTKKSPSRLTKKKVLLRSSLASLAVLLGAGGFLGVKALDTVNKVFHGNILSDATAAFNDTPLKGENTGRVNILLAGDSSDDAGHGGSSLTDSILVLSIDTQNHSVFLLSIPRDLWVDIPGYGWQKINAANNNLGTNFPGYPKNGMGQLEHLVTTDLGIPIDYYALSNYGAFKDAVNAVGGVSVNIQSPDPRGLFDAYTNLNLSNGQHVLDGQQALNLARARGDGSAGDVSYGFRDSDFGRTQHQRQLFTGITEKAKSLGFLSNPVKISDLMDAFSNNVGTDLSLQNVLRLVQITKGINLSSIQPYAYCATLTPSCSTPILTTYTDPASGEEAFIPKAGIGDYGQMEQYYQRLSSNNPVVKEGASVVILNASNAVGLAKQQQPVLQADGFNVATIADANSGHPTTMIVDNSNGSEPNSLKLLQKLYPGTTVTSTLGSPEAAEAQGYTANFVVILGQNWDGTNANTP